MARMLANPEKVAQVRAVITDAREQRRLDKLVVAAEKELAAAEDWDAKRAADAEKEALRVAELTSRLAGQSLKYWEEVDKAIDATTEVLARLLREFDNFPPVIPGQMRKIDRALDRLTAQIHRYEVRLHPVGRNYREFEGVIDV
jgi:hypothetical protein